MACNADNGGCSQLCKALPEGKQTYARLGGRGGGGKGGTQRGLIRGDSVPRSDPLSFYIPFLTERYLFRIPSIDK